MLLRLLLLFTIVPFVELLILLWIADRTSWTFTIALVIFTGVVGATLARYEGLRCLGQVQDRLRRGEVPAGSLLDGLMILVAGALLVTPGVLTDLVGFSFFLPPVRGLIKRFLAHRIRAKFETVAFSSRLHPREEEADRDRVIDVRIVDVESRDPEDQQQR